MQIVVLDGHGVNPGDLSWDCLSNIGTLSVYDRTPDQMVAQRLRGADAVFTNKTRLGREQLLGAKSLRFIGVLATGYDVVDTAAARELGIVVCNVPAYSTMAVAQHSFALLLELCSKVGVHNALVHRGAWSASPDFCWWQSAPVELDGLTLGVCGCGAIGRRVAAIGAAFGMRVIGFNPTLYQGFCGEYVTMDALIRESDVLSLHCPANPKTVGLINRRSIAMMRDGALIVNTARGGLVVEQDVKDALVSGKLGGYAADVASREPIDVHAPLMSAPNCILTGHMAWAPQTARERLLLVSAQNLLAFLEGRPQNKVN